MASTHVQRTKRAGMAYRLIRRGLSLHAIRVYLAYPSVGAVWNAGHRYASPRGLAWPVRRVKA